MLFWHEKLRLGAYWIFWSADILFPIISTFAIKNLLQCCPRNHSRCPCLDDAVKISRNRLQMFKPCAGIEINPGFNGQIRVRLGARTDNNTIGPTFRSVYTCNVAYRCCHKLTLHKSTLHIRPTTNNRPTGCFSRFVMNRPAMNLPMMNRPQDEPTVSQGER